MPAKRLPPAAPPPGASVSSEPEGASAPGLLRVVVEIGGRRYDEDLAAQAAIAPNIEALNEALGSNPGRFAEWAMLEALAREEFDLVVSNLEALESDMKDLEARIYLEALERPKDVPLTSVWKPPTVDAAKAAVTVDPRRADLSARRRALEEGRLAAKASLEKISVGRRTIEKKETSLMALGANWRQEMQTKLSIAARQFVPGRPGG